MEKSLIQLTSKSHILSGISPATAAVIVPAVKKNAVALNKIELL